MANTEEAVQFVLRQEDSRLSGAITTLAGDRGGATRFGIASRFHPELVERGFYEVENGEPKVGHDEALAIADGVYAEQYGAKVRIDEISNQDVANRILSFAVNEGVPEAVSILQKALNSIGKAVSEDGVLGPATIAAVNAVDPEQLITANRVYQKQFYRNLVAARPALLPYLDGLLNRAAA